MASAGQINTAQRSEPYPLPAPVGGLNGRDGLSQMAPTDAYEMDNLFPGTIAVTARNGCEQHQGGTGTPIRSLATYSGGDAADKILAFSADKIYDASIKGAMTLLKSGMLSDKVISAMFGTVADKAQWLIITTGSDIPKSYNGVAIADLAITGITEGPQNINYVCAFKGRLYFAVNGRLGFYYLAPGAIQGAAEWFDLAQVTAKGGSLRAIGTYSQDSGDGPNDYIVFVTSKGEYLMYGGFDPSSVDNFEIVGRYVSSEPIGRKCLCDYANDLLCLTVEGAIQFSAIKRYGDTRSEIFAISSKLGDRVLRRNAFQDVYGWCMQTYPVGGWLIVSVPNTTSEAGDFDHFVMNTITQAWCRFKGDEWNAVCWTVANRKLYYGRYDGKVMLADSATQSDNNKNITFVCKQAYTQFDYPGNKHFQWALVMCGSEAPVLITGTINVDFKDYTPPATPLPLAVGQGAVWDQTFWDTEYWAQGIYTQEVLTTFNNFGTYGSFHLEGNVKGASFQWYSTKFVNEKAQGLL